MRNDILALDINLGCSGFVNSLAVASSLLQSKAINNCLIVCAETYSKFINPNDRTNKMIFSDAASACLVERKIVNHPLVILNLAVMEKVLKN